MLSRVVWFTAFLIRIKALRVIGFADWRQNCKRLKNAEQDDQMLKACLDTYGKFLVAVRVATHDELRELEIENTSGYYLMGACGGGKSCSASYINRHKGTRRWCWLPGENTSIGNKWSCCKNKGRRAALCVFNHPTQAPSLNPTTDHPSQAPSLKPTTDPSEIPTSDPTMAPSRQPTITPTRLPTTIPTRAPTSSPTDKLSSSPTAAPTPEPTSPPTSNPTACKDNFLWCERVSAICSTVEEITRDYLFEVCPESCGVCKNNFVKDVLPVCEDFPYFCDEDFRKYCPSTCGNYVTESPTSMPTTKCDGVIDTLENYIDFMISTKCDAVIIDKLEGHIDFITYVFCLKYKENKESC